MDKATSTSEKSRCKSPGSQASASRRRCLAIRRESVLHPVRATPKEWEGIGVVFERLREFLLDLSDA